jgi:hypothetical protein
VNGEFPAALPVVIHQSRLVVGPEGKKEADEFGGVRDVASAGFKTSRERASAGPSK